MKMYKRKPIWGIIGAALAMLMGLGGVFEEVSFRVGAAPVTGIVREWQSKKLFGFSGMAKVEVDRGNERSRSLRWPVKTCLWYRPGPGDKIALLENSWKPFRVASYWQGFGFQLFLILGSIAWAKDVEVETRKQKAVATKSETKDENLK